MEYDATIWDPYQKYNSEKEMVQRRAATQKTVGKETIAFGLHFASVFPSSDILNGYVTNTEANIHVALSSHRNSHLYITFFHVL